MNCNYCGKALPNDSEFCAYCGKAVEKDLPPKCPKCGKNVTDDSLFCPYCGSAIGSPTKTAVAQAPSIAETAKKREVINARVIPAPKHISQERINAAAIPTVSKNIPTSQVGENKKSKKPIIFIIVAIIAIALAAVLFSQPVNTPPPPASNNSVSTLTPVWEPVSGSVLESNRVQCDSSLTVSASSGNACVVRVKYPTGNTVLSFYVRAGETATVDVPARPLQVFFASGDTWYGFDNLFGPETQYSKDDDVLDFGEYTYEYTLYPVTNGNFSQTPIDASDF